MCLLSGHLDLMMAVGGHRVAGIQLMDQHLKVEIIGNSNSYCYHASSVFKGCHKSIKLLLQNGIKYFFLAYSDYSAQIHVHVNR